MEGSDMNVSEKMDMVSTDMGMMSTNMGMMSTDMGMVMSGHQHGAHYRGMDGPGDESGKFILAVQILFPNIHLRNQTESRKFTTKLPRLEILRCKAESNELCIRITINNSRFTVSAFIFLLQTEYLGTSHWGDTLPHSF